MLHWSLELGWKEKKDKSHSHPHTQCSTQSSQQQPLTKLLPMLSLLSSPYNLPLHNSLPQCMLQFITVVNMAVRRLSQSLIAAVLISMLLGSSAQSQSACSNHTFSGDKVFRSCTDLPSLDAYLHWNYFKPTQKVQVAFRATQTLTGWTSWAINPTGTGMVGSQAIVAFRSSNGSLMAYPTPITSYVPSMEPGVLSFDVSNLTAEYVNNQMVIYAVLGPLNLSNNVTSVNHVWQVGSLYDDVPLAHSMSGENTQSLGTWELFSS